MTVQITGEWYVDEDGSTWIQVWCHDLDESLHLPATMLTPTGVRIPPEPLGRRIESLQVSASGDVLGSSSYIVIDDPENYV